MSNPNSSYKKFRRRMFNQSIRFISLARSFSSFQREAKRRCERFTDIPYMKNGHPAHLMDIYRPITRNSKLPVLMYIHGGGFTVCSKDTHQGISLAYANNGYLVCNINYRLAPNHRFPSALEDIAHAYKWIISHAEEYGGDPDRIVIGGESAGANLTLALAVACCYERNELFAKMIWDTGVVPKAILVLCGLLQVSDPYRLHRVCPPINKISRTFDLSIARDVSRAYIGRNYKTPRPEIEMADPLCIIESQTLPARPFPTVYAMVGTHDILLNDTQRLEKALIKKSVKHNVNFFQKEGHAFHLMGFSKQAMVFWKQHLAFLRREILE